MEPQVSAGGAAAFAGCLSNSRGLGAEKRAGW